MIRRLTLLLLAATCMLTAAARPAERAGITDSKALWLPHLFQSGMVLQRGKPIPVWGTAAPHTTVTLRWNNRPYRCETDDAGRWRVDLPAMKAGGPYTLVVSGEDGAVREITDVMVGDVWLCSGQSNVDVTIERVYPQYPDEIDSFCNNKIRLFRVQTDKDTHGPKSDILPTEWKVLTKENVWKFSALGTFLALRMQRETGVAQGIICNSLGGTPVEAWVGADSLVRDFPLYVERTRLWQDDELVAAQDKANQRAGDRWFQQLNEGDPGVSEQWSTDWYDDTSWDSVNQYGNIAGQPGSNYIGSLWLRQHIHISKEHAGKAARLLLGTLFDQDYTYVNGQEVGRTYYQYPPRRYQVPEGLLHEGDNVITVRFVNKYGIPHFLPDKPYMMIFGPSDTLRLSDTWKVRRGKLMPSCPSGGTSIQNLPTVLYNAMLHPLAPYAISGVVWYQGESNVGEPQLYAPLLRKMMGNWRTLWGDPSLPFCIVQLANYDPNQQSAVPQPARQRGISQRSNWAELRDAQRTVADGDPFAELAVAIDLGETVDIHPLRKKEVAERVARCMDRLVFQKKVSLSPKVVGITADATTLTLTFDQPLRGVDVQCIEVAGADGRYVSATARAQGTTVTLSSPVSHPVCVRYAWSDDPAGANLYSKEGLPAVPFRLPVNSPLD